jgi:acetyl-CoA synthetase
MAVSYQISSFEQYHKEYKRSVEDPEGFWAEIASRFYWRKPWDNVLSWSFKTPEIKWFSGGKLNITENCLDRHIAKLGDSPAIVWEPNNPNEMSRTLTYSDLLFKVNQFSHVLKNNGVKKGDRVCIYMGMVPELVIAILACARVGAIHSVVFGGFSAQSIADRLQDAQGKFVITCDGAFRGNKEIPLKGVIDDALEKCPFVERVIVLTRTKTPVSMMKTRDVWWEDEIRKVESQGNPEFPAEVMDAEDMLFILYTSGSTGKPKGVVHTIAGYMIFVNYTFLNVFQYKPGEIHFCTADIGWITGHSYIVYGPLSAGATSLMFEGIPTWPDAGRFWEITDKHKVNILYTAPTAIRSLMSYGTEPVLKHDLSSLRVLGTVGEPINEEAWHWYDEYVGKKKCPIVDTWWQTETGGIMISNLAGVTPSKPSFATLYFTGDGCLRDENGFYRITGRVDDVLNVSGHRIGTAEVENAINMHTGIVESAVVGFPHEIKGQGIYAYVICSQEPADAELMRKDICSTVSRVIGAIAKPDKIQFVKGLPKTRSGKIMRRILRKIAEGEMKNLGDTTTLLDPAVVEEIKNGKV